MSSQAAKDRKERKKVLYRYIPDVARAVFGVLQDTVAKGKSTRRWLLFFGGALEDGSVSIVCA